MHAGEIMTVRRLGLKIIIVVLRDGELNLIRIKQSWKSVNPYGVQVSNGSLFGAKRFLGTEVVRVTDAEAMRSAVTRALRYDDSVIIEAVSDPSLYGDIVVRS
jgi:acetolactate synthase-1/2/3 large subunit